MVGFGLSRPAVRPRPATCLVLLSLTGLACGKDSSGPNTDQFASAYADQLCELLYRCCAPADVIRLFYNGAPIAGVADCKAEIARATGHLGQIIRERTAPFSYDPARAAQCLARLPTLSCADLASSRQQRLAPALECSSVFELHPHGAPGAVCYQPYDCDPGLACDSPAHDHAGICRPVEQVKFACPDCGKNAYCDGASAAMCVPRLPDGSPCMGDGRCASLVCCGSKPGVSASGTCGLPANICTGNIAEGTPSVDDAGAVDADAGPADAAEQDANQDASPTCTRPDAGSIAPAPAGCQFATLRACPDSRAEPACPFRLLETPLQEVARTCGITCGTVAIGWASRCVAQVGPGTIGVLAGTTEQAARTCLWDKLRGERWSCAPEDGWVNAFLGSCTLP